LKPIYRQPAKKAIDTAKKLFNRVASPVAKKPRRELLPFALFAAVAAVAAIAAPARRALFPRADGVYAVLARNCRTCGDKMREWRKCCEKVSATAPALREFWRAEAGARL
jgi:hypothetical protein